MPDAQDAHIKDKSTKTALHTLVSHIEKVLHYKEYALVAFLHINRAFIISLISKLISSRLIISCLGVSSIHKVVTSS